jgi:serine/threonine protein kinase
MFPSKADQDSFSARGYEIIRELGRGGMGVILLAKSSDLNRLVVIKTLTETNKNSKAKIRFQREAQSLAHFSHRNIVTVHEFGEHHGRPYIVMTYIKGHTLTGFVEQSLKQGKSPDISWTCKTFLLLARALLGLHAQGIVHRDFKPDNILISQDTGEPVLVDFGLAKIDPSQFLTTLESLTLSGHIIGTPGFLPPEQLEPKSEFGESSPASDVWGFGATLFYTLTGHAPFSANTLLELAAILLTKRAPRTRSFYPDIPSWLDELCSQCLETSTAARPSLEQIIQCLESSGKQGLKRSHHKKITLFAATGSLLIALVIAYYYGSRDTAPPKLELQSETTLITRKNSLVIKGRVIDQYPEALLINGQRVELNKDGTFRTRLLLSNSSQTYSLKAIDSSGLQSAATELDIIVDKTLPRLKIDPIPLSTSTTLTITGTADEKLRGLRIGKQTGSIEGLRFNIQFNIEKVEGKFQLEAEDLAGNISSSPLLVSLVHRTGKGSHGSLVTAIIEASDGHTIFLGPGHFRLPERLTRAVRIVGISDKREIIIFARGSSLLKVLGKQVSLKNISLQQRGKKNVALSVSSGGLTLDQCHVDLEGQASLNIGSKNSKKSSSLSLTNCQCVFRGEIGSTITKTNLTMNSVTIVDKRQHLFIDSKTSLLTLTDCENFSLKNVKLHHSRGSNLIIENSSGTIDRMTLHHGNKKGLYVLGSNVQIAHSDFHTNRCEGLSIEKYSEVKVHDSRFINNGQAMEDSLPGIRIAQRSKLWLTDCRIEKHMHYGIHAFNNSRVTLQNCQFKNNKPGPWKIENNAKVSGQ